MTANVDYVGSKIFKAYKDKTNILYVPKYWALIMFIHGMIPAKFFQIIKKFK
jgi:hypothetical protein